MNKNKKLSLAKLKKLADKALSGYIRNKSAEQYGYTCCPLCNDNPIQCMFHFISRRKAILRWDEKNVIGACHRCNFEERYFPDKSRVWYIRTHGLDQYLKLVYMAEQSFAVTEKYLQSVIKRYS